MNDLQIRNAEIKDCEKISNIYNNYLGTATLDLEVRSAFYFEKMIKNFDDREIIIVALLNDKIIGYALIKKYSYKAGYKYAAETSTFLDPDFLNKGFGTTLKKHLIEKAKSLDYKYLVAKIFATNQKSINFNLKLGYQIVGTQKHIGNVNGKWLNTTIMGLNL